VKIARGLRPLWPPPADRARERLTSRHDAFPGLSDRRELRRRFRRVARAVRRERRAEATAALQRQRLIPRPPSSGPCPWARGPPAAAAAQRPGREWPVSRAFPYPGASHHEERATARPAAYRTDGGRPAPGGWCLQARQRRTTAGVGGHAAPSGHTAASAPGRPARPEERSVHGRHRPYRPRGMTSCRACLGRPGASRRRITYPGGARRPLTGARHAGGGDGRAPGMPRPRRIAGGPGRRRSTAVRHFASSAALPAFHAIRPDQSHPD
jgi:hypothetical protein